MAGTVTAAFCLDMEPFACSSETDGAALPAELGPALLERMLAVWHALLGPAWAEWLRGGKALREGAALSAGSSDTAAAAGGSPHISGVAAGEAAVRIQHATNRKSGVNIGKACRLVEPKAVACACRLRCASMRLCASGAERMLALCTEVHVQWCECRLRALQQCSVFGPSIPLHSCFGLLLGPLHIKRLNCSSYIDLRQDDMHAWAHITSLDSYNAARR